MSYDVPSSSASNVLSIRTSPKDWRLLLSSTNSTLPLNLGQHLWLGVVVYQFLFTWFADSFRYWAMSLGFVWLNALYWYWTSLTCLKRPSLLKSSNHKYFKFNPYRLLTNKDCLQKSIDNLCFIWKLKRLGSWRSGTGSASGSGSWFLSGSHSSETSS